MQINDLVMEIVNCEEVSYTNRDGKEIKFLRCRARSGAYDDPFQVNCTKIVPDGKYHCALEIKYDFNSKKDRVKLYVGEPV